MNYVLKVESCDIDKVVLKLSEHGDLIVIKNILRSTGIIKVKTDLINEMRKIVEILEIKEVNLIPQLLFFL